MTASLRRSYPHYFYIAHFSSLQKTTHKSSSNPSNNLYQYFYGDFNPTNNRIDYFKPLENETHFYPVSNGSIMSCLHLFFRAVLSTLIQYFTVNGVIDPEALFAPPFTDIASNGLTDVFTYEQAADIVSLVEKVNQNAIAV